MTQRSLPMALFALATLAPLALFAAAILWGGWWAPAPFAYITVFAMLLDHITGLFLGNVHEGAEFPAADALLVVLAIGSLCLMPAVVWAVAGPSGLTGWGRFTIFMGAGLWFGQVANPTAHELIHRSPRALFRLGGLVYCALLFGHHTSAHRLVHHRHAASLDDPNTARSGEGYYAFLIRAWIGSFMRGWLAENDLRARVKTAGGKSGLHPYAVYIGLAVLCLACGSAIAGGWGLLGWLALALHAQSQLMLSDYVQHYGLLRVRRADGKLEPVSARHSWNAPHWFSSAYMLNAPRHSDHHAHPARPYPALRLPTLDEAPHLPWPLPFACMLALCPPIWKRAIRPHLKKWRLPA
jgi:alkane 1-monooxygenase